MQRDFIIVAGMQGFGKSTWTKLYGASKPRLLVYDPKGEYPGVDYMSDPSEWVSRVTRRELKTFRFGTWHADEVAMFGNAAYAAGDSTFIMEECALLFDKGEPLPDWAKPPIFMGRDQKMNLVLVAQRAASIPLDVRSQASRIVTFLQTDPDDVRALASRIGKEYAEQIRSLPMFECIDWQAGALGISVKRYAIHA